MICQRDKKPRGSAGSSRSAGPGTGDSNALARARDATSLSWHGLTAAPEATGNSIETESSDASIKILNPMRSAFPRPLPPARKTTTSERRL